MKLNEHLTEAAFAALAAGAGGSAAVHMLKRSRLDRHILQIGAIMHLAPDGLVDDAIDLLAAAQRENPVSVDRVLTDPSVGAWAARCLRRLRGTIDDSTPIENDVRQFAAVAAAAAVRSGHPFHIAATRRHGTVWLPTLGVARIHCDPDPWGTAWISHDGHRTEVRIGDHRVTLPTNAEEDSPGWLGLRRIRSDHAGQAIEIAVDDIDIGRDGYGHELAPRLDDSTFERLRKTLDEAWTILTAQNPQRAAELATGMVVFVPLQPAVAGKGASITGKDAFGQFAATTGVDGAFFAETLIHEFQHSKLYALTDIVDLHTAGPDQIHYSPWRDDPRPLEGLIHGAYSYVGVADYWNVQQRVLNGPEQKFAQFEFMRWSQQINNTIKVLLQSGFLTEPGTKFVQGMADTVASWPPAPSDSQLERLVKLVISDHRLRWRLRSLVPDAAAVVVLANAWNERRPNPMNTATIASTVKAQERNLQLSPRLRLIYTLVQHPDRYARLVSRNEWLASFAPSLSQADVALLDGETATAQRLFCQRIQERPDDIEQWAGLALARSETSSPADRLTTAPEVAFNLYQQLDDAGELDELLAWLTNTADSDRGRQPRHHRPEHPAATMWR